MSAQRLVFVDSASGAVCSTWSGDSSRTPATPPGYTVVDVTALDVGDVHGCRWTGAAFAPLPRRVLQRLDFARLFTPDEDIAIAASTDPRVAMYFRRLQFASQINLDHDDVVSGLTYMVTQGLLTTERRAAILAGTPPGAPPVEEEPPAEEPVEEPEEPTEPPPDEEEPPAEEEPTEPEPEPVDAVVSAWSPWGNPTEWVPVTDQTVLDTLGTASADARTRSRTRTVISEAQHGGVTPALSEEQVEYRFSGSNIPQWGNENFDARAAREDCFRAVAMRSAADVERYRHANLASALPAQGLTPQDVQCYDPAIDATRFVLPPTFANIEQSWIGFGANPAPVRLSVVWEVALSESWRPHIVGDGFKFLQVRSTGGSGGKIWVEPNLMSGRGAGDQWCLSWLRLYSSAIAPDAFKGPFRVDADGTLYRQPYPAGVEGQDYGSDQLGPVTRNVYLPVNTPAKVLVDLDVTGQPYGTASQIVYLTYAVRIADADPIVIIDRAPITLPLDAQPSHADVEGNQSQPRPAGVRGNTWAHFWAKNITMHRNCAEPVALLVAE